MPNLICIGYSRVGLLSERNETWRMNKCMHLWKAWVIYSLLALKHKNNCKYSWQVCLLKTFLPLFAQTRRHNDGVTSAVWQTNALGLVEYCNRGFKTLSAIDRPIRQSFSDLCRAAKVNILQKEIYCLKKRTKYLKISLSRKQFWAGVGTWESQRINDLLVDNKMFKPFQTRRYVTWPIYYSLLHTDKVRDIYIYIYIGHLVLLR